MELIQKYFTLTPLQHSRFEQLGPLYREWNEKINVISRKDIDHLYDHHVLHSLALAKYNPFKDQMRVLDVGTGGGFPGIPLAIMYPDVQFVLLDSTAKKIRVVEEVANALQLTNVQGVHARVEDHKGAYDIVTSRAVSSLTQMVAWTKHLVPSGRWVILKGGHQHDIRKELPPNYKIKFIAIEDYFPMEYYQDKFIVDVQLK